MKNRYFLIGIALFPLLTNASSIKEEEKISEKKFKEAKKFWENKAKLEKQIQSSSLPKEKLKKSEMPLKSEEEKQEQVSSYDLERLLKIKGVADRIKKFPFKPNQSPDDRKEHLKFILDMAVNSGFDSSRSLSVSQPMIEFMACLEEDGETLSKKGAEKLKKLVIKHYYPEKEKDRDYYLGELKELLLASIEVGFPKAIVDELIKIGLKLYPNDLSMNKIAKEYEMGWLKYRSYNF